MICDRCEKREASVFIQQNVDNIVTERNLCAECARDIMQNGSDAAGDFMNTYFSQALPVGIFQGLGGIPSFGPKPSPVAPSRVCPSCKTTEEEFRKTGLIGCAACYDTFSDRMEQIFARVQASSRHTGREYQQEPCPMPEPDPLVSLRQEIGQQQKQLRESVEKEDYETAARLRDRIRAMEAQLLEMQKALEPEAMDKEDTDDEFEKTGEGRV